MGLITYFKDLYYNNKLNKANQLLLSGKAADAELILVSLVDKHPLAASKLAEYYLSLSQSTDVKNDISYFNKTLALKSKGAKVYDATIYNNVVINYIKHIRERASSCYASGAYEDCSSLTMALQAASNASPNDVVMGAGARLHLVLNAIKDTKVSSGSFSSLMDSFRKEWDVCNTNEESFVEQFCQKLRDSKRYYVSGLLTGIIRNNPFDEKCIDDSYHVIKGEDNEPSKGIIASIASKYCKRIVLRDGIRLEDAVLTFECCWKETSDAALMMDVFRSVKKADLKDAITNHIFNTHSTYFSNDEFLDGFLKWVMDTVDGEASLSLLEKLHNLGYKVEKYYTKKTHDLVSPMKCDAKLPYLNHAQSLFPNSELIINDKLSCAQQFLKDKENEKAITVSDSILEKCPQAWVVKAHALCNVANSELDLDKRIELLEQAYSALDSCPEKIAPVHKTSVIDSFIQTANEYFNKGKAEKAYSVLTKWAKMGYEQAAFLIAKHRLLDVQATKEAADREMLVYGALSELKAFEISSITNNDDFLQLWDEKISIVVGLSKKEGDASAVVRLEKLLKELELVGFDAEDFKDRRATVVKNIVKRKCLIARNLELSGNFSDAAKKYKEIVFLEAKKTPTLSALRFMLCKLKASDSTEILEHKDQIYSLLRKAPAALKSERNDIAYRFALVLLKSGEDKEALAVLDEFLPDEEYLKKACEQGAMIKAIAKLDDFNGKIEAVKDKTLPAEDAIFFINHILDYASTIKPLLDIPRSVLQDVRNKLKNYAIFKLFDEGRYDVAFEKLIKEHKDYLDDYTALRNIALVCLNMAEEKQLTNSNYQEVIAVWLTSVYQERLFIESLDYTSWDDPYTFSLYDAYGHFNEDTYDDLPENVNFDDSNDDNVVHIKEVQRTLLDRFEAAISDVQKYHLFYTEQKDTMDRFIALNLDDKCKLVAPYLAHKDDDVFQDIHDALENDRQEGYDNWEDVLSVGALYQMPETIYRDYSAAKANYDECIDSINTMNATKAATAFVSAKVSLIKKFDKLSSALISCASSKISALSSDNKNEFKKNYDFYLLVCDAIKDNTLSFVFSNYVMRYVVDEVNKKSMGMAAAANIIISIYMLDKTNDRVKDNLTTLFEMLARENTPAATKAVTMVLDKLKAFNPTLYQNFKNEYDQAKVEKELVSIAEGIKGGTTTKAKALEKVYSVYSNNPDNSPVCEILAQLCCGCIMEYVIPQKSGSSSVEKILNSLISNRSDEFKRHTSELKKLYNNIWNQIPPETQMLLEGKYVGMGTTLNDKGLALKKGLNYLKEIGGFSARTFMSSLF